VTHGLARNSPAEDSLLSCRRLSRRKALEAWRRNHLIRRGLHPQGAPVSSWDVYRQAHKAIWLRTVEATDATLSRRWQRSVTFRPTG
jgi:hypothetical protein